MSAASSDPPPGALPDQQQRPSAPSDAAAAAAAAGADTAEAQGRSVAQEDGDSTSDEASEGEEDKVKEYPLGLPAHVRPPKQPQLSGEEISQQLARFSTEDTELLRKLRESRVAQMPKFVFPGADTTGTVDATKANGAGAAAAPAPPTFTFAPTPPGGIDTGAGAFASAAAAAPAPAPFAFKLGGSFGSSATAAPARPARKSAGSSSAAAHRPRHQPRHSHGTQAAAASGPVSIGLPSAPSVFEFGAASSVIDESSVRAPSRVHLYRHALECVFQFLPHGSLGRVMAVSHEWASAVERMKPTGGVAEPGAAALLDVDAMLASRLARHVGRIGGLPPKTVLLTPDQLARVSARCPSLRALHTIIVLEETTSRKEVVNLVLPPTLTTLQVNIALRFKLLEECHAQREQLLSAVAASLPLLETLLVSVYPETKLGVLEQLPRLRNLEALVIHNHSGNLDSLCNTIRCLPQLHRMRLQGTANRRGGQALHNDALAALLAVPHHLQWRDIGPVWLEDENARLLTRLPSLTRLDAVFGSYPESFQFLCELPALESLDLSRVERPLRGKNVRVNDTLVAAAVNGGVASLTQLRLSGEVIAHEELGAVLKRTSRLRELALLDCLHVESLDGVLDGVRATLERLSLLNTVTRAPPRDDAVEDERTRGWLLAAEDMQHIVRCEQLRELTLSRVLPLDAFARQPFEQRPCALLPALEVLRYDAPLVWSGKKKDDSKFAFLNAGFKRRI